MDKIHPSRLFNDMLLPATEAVDASGFQSVLANGRRLEGRKQDWWILGREWNCGGSLHRGFVLQRGLILQRGLMRTRKTKLLKNADGHDSGPEELKVSLSSVVCASTGAGLQGAKYEAYFRMT